MNNDNQRNQVAGRRVSPKVLLLTLVATMLLGACGGGKEGQAAGAQVAEGPTAKALAVPSGWVGRKPPSAIALKVAELEASGVLPKLDTSNSIAGPDTNRNGIRDDIDKILTERGLSTGTKHAADRLAKSLQGILVVDLSNETALLGARVELATATKCLFNTMVAESGVDAGVDSAAKLAGQLEQLTANTKLRAKSLIEFSKSVSGMSFKEGACE